MNNLSAQLQENLKIFRPLLLLVISGLFVSCKKEIPFNFKGKDHSTLTVNALFHNTDSIYLQLSLSSSVKSGNDPSFVNNGTIKLTDGDELVTSFVYIKEGIYRPTSPLDLFANSNYHLEVYVPNMEKITSSQKIPLPIDFNFSEIEINEDDSSQYKLNLEFQDNSAVKNYYSLVFFIQDTIYQDSTNKDKFYLEKDYLPGSTYDPSIIKVYEDIEPLYSSNLFLYDDRLFNGKKHKTTININYSVEGQDTIEVFAELKSLSEDLFKYVLTKEKYKNANADPFAHPVQIYSNIENGLGIFGGFTVQEKKLKLIFDKSH